MSGLLFVPQATLDGWLAEGRVDVSGDGLVIPGGPTLPLESACRFVEILDGEDTAGLLGKVKAEPLLREMGGELCGDSVLLGEVAYSVIPGFVASTPAPGGAPSIESGDLPRGEDEPDRLAAFFG
ncbi:hypothetical protein [Vulgatibacter incomptus]|uniref:Uncharacterized protein n=1 Tax=Vulgatibacter incomptus TaxID=1391653 RepID=A0A0K1PCQ8_9BACT|nr:hypothetical protein [Vulgatibacter incomptus]AKU91201.1 hypothetical protein AKJ08_1588 [Vulgatibacter incomptus]